MTKFTIAISGPAASGKTRLLTHIKNNLPEGLVGGEIIEIASPEGFCERIEVTTTTVEKYVFEKYMFENRVIKRTTWLELQKATDHGALVCTKALDVEKASPVFKLRDPCSEEVCYVFTDEAEHFSNPYSTIEEAAKMSRKYAKSL